MTAKKWAVWTSFSLILCVLPLRCKKNPTTAAIDNPGQQPISVSCSPNTAGPDAIITVSIIISNNATEIRVFGLEATFDTKMFQFQEVSKGSLTGSWAAVDGNEASPGTLRIGGFVGQGTSIAKNSNGALADIKFKVTGQTYGNGQQTQVCIGQYTDDISLYQPESSCTTFTLKK